MMNRKLHPELETVFMMPAEQYSYLSSRLVREVAQLGGSVQALVPEIVERRLKEKLDPAIKLQHARNTRDRKTKHDSRYRSTRSRETRRPHQPH